VLVDFGAAKHATATLLAKTGTGIGKPSYGAPEQMLGKSVFQSDLFGLGVTCLHLLTNVEPFTLYDVLENEYQWRQFLNGKIVSDKFGKLLDRMIAYRVKERPNSVTDALKDLQISVISQPFPNLVSNNSRSAGSQASIQIPSRKSPKPSPSKPSQISNLEFEYIKTRLVTERGFFFGLGSKTRVELDRKLGKTQYIRENIGNNVTIDLVRIPAGKFIMGQVIDEHEVTLQEFWMGKYTVTQKQYQAVTGCNPSHFKGENLPVENVSWNDARLFCEKISKSTGKNFRLPTESEWEYACRASTTTNYHFGDVITTDIANYNGGNSLNFAQGEFRSKTVPVDSFYPNQWGLYQMHGNVWEWCLDEWHDKYSKKPPHLKASGNKPWVSKTGNSSCLHRGGNWKFHSFYCRSATRYEKSLTYFFSNYIGFRVVVIFS
jgi:formylglycine-generating enzyme required for sulfatase activity